MTADSDARRAEADAQGRLADYLINLRDRAGQYNTPGATIPALSEDPPATSLTNMWLLDGRLRMRLPDGTVVQTTMTATGSSTATVPIVTDTPPSRYQDDYKATWGVTYCPTHGQEAGSLLYYGGDDGTHGNRKIMLGFNAAAIASDLSGAVVRNVQIRLLNVNSWSPNGGDIHFGVHNSTSAPASFAGTRREVWVGQWPDGDYNDWADLPPYVGRALQAGTIKGLTIDQPAGIPFSGQMDWTTAALRLQYTK